MESAAQIRQAQRPNEATDSRVGPAILAALLVVTAWMLSNALIQLDANQAQIHQQEVTTELAR